LVAKSFNVDVSVKINLQGAFKVNVLLKRMMMLLVTDCVIFSQGNEFNLIQFNSIFGADSALLPPFPSIPFIFLSFPSPHRQKVAAKSS